MLAPLLRRLSATAPPRARQVTSSAVGLAASVLKPVGAGYAITITLALVFQRKLQYFPTAERPDLEALKTRLPPAYDTIEEHEVEASDGTKCFLWHWPAPDVATAPSDPTFLDAATNQRTRDAMKALRAQHDFGHLDVVLFHGNAGNRMHRIYWAYLLREGLGCSVTVLDYRGYGGSGGSPTEQGLIRDGAAAVTWLHEQQKRRPAGTRKPALARPRRPVLWGESIGSGVLVALLAGDDAAADGGGGDGGASGVCDESLATQPLAVVEAGFTSCADLGAHAYPWIPVRLGMLDKFESDARARRMASAGMAGVPMLCLHGTNDEIAPLDFGRRLFDVMPAPRKRFVELADTGHNDVPYRDPPRYLRTIAKFFADEDDEI